MFDSLFAFLDAHGIGITAAATAIIAFFTIVLACATYVQARLTRQAINQARRSADAALLTAKATMASQRGYVTISHHPPGLDINQSNGTVAVHIRIENAGRSPATVTKTVLKLDGFSRTTQLPADPDYDSGRVQVDFTEAPLAPGGGVNKLWQFKWKPGDLNVIQRGRGQMWLYGYVEYTDVFEQRYCARYGRVYDHTRDSVPVNFRNNLPFIPQGGYN